MVSGLLALADRNFSESSESVDESVHTLLLLLLLSADILATPPRPVAGVADPRPELSLNVFCRLTRYHVGRLISPPGPGADGLVPVRPSDHGPVCLSLNNGE